MLVMKKINDIDFNLLRLLPALINSTNLTQAAQSLMMSQSSLSHALKRLREQVGDQIVITQSGHYRATETAQALLAQVQPALHQIEQGVATARGEHRSCDRYQCIILGTDWSELYLMPKVYQALGSEISIDFRNDHKLDRTDLLNGNIHMMLGMFASLPETCYSQRLFDDGLAVIARSNCPYIVQGRISLSDYLAADHLFLTQTGVGGGPVDYWLRKMGLSRKKRGYTRHFTNAGYLVSQSDMLCTVPARYALEMCQHLPVQAASLPSEFSEMTINKHWMFNMVWSASFHNHPGHRQVRQAIARVADSLPGYEQLLEQLK